MLGEERAPHRGDGTGLDREPVTGELVDEHGDAVTAEADHVGAELDRPDGECRLQPTEGRRGVVEHRLRRPAAVVGEHGQHCRVRQCGWTGERGDHGVAVGGRWQKTVTCRLGHVGQQQPQGAERGALRRHVGDVTGTGRRVEPDEILHD